MIQRLLLLTLMALMVPALACADSVYRWTDESGVVHFGDREPQGRSSERVSVKSGQSRSSERPSPQEQVEALEEGEADKERRENESAVEEARRKQRNAKCETARANLDAINSNARIRMAGEDGEPRYLSPEEIETQKSRFQEMADENCESSES